MKDGRLEVSDLMIGDLCTSPDLNNKPAYWTGNISYHKKQVEGPTIWYKRYEFLYSGGGEGAMVPDSRIFPIPLTKEILEKIGLRKGYAAEYYDQDIYSDEFDTFGLKEGIDGSYVFETYTDWCKRCPDGSPEDYGISTVNNIVGIKYLHELQHALNLCGIEKEIIL